MTLTTIELDQARRYNTATLATLREVPDVVELLRSSTHQDPTATEPSGTVWELWTHAIEDDQPMLVLGIRGERGFLRWYTATETSVPRHTTYQDESHDYWHGGQAQSCSTGEEIPVEYVFAAVGEFVATGKRPTIIQWVNATEVPDQRTPNTLADSPVYQAMRAAVEGD